MSPNVLEKISINCEKRIEVLEAGNFELQNKYDSVTKVYSGNGR